MLMTLAVFVASICAAASDSGENHNAFDVRQVKAAMLPLDLENPCATPPAIEEYFRFYGIDFDSTRHCFGTFSSDSFEIAAHVFVPESACGTVFLLHGYYDHVGIQKNTIRLCLKQRLCVAAFDLPGHGLSSGERAAIDNFSQYARALADFLNVCRGQLPQAYLAVGHSTGCAAILEYLFTCDSRAFKKVVLIAPPVRSTFHHASKLGHALWRPFSETGPRWFRNSSSDKKFLEFYRSDPLQYDRFPLRWARAIYAWQERMKQYDTLSVPMSVIQGTDDDVVDWRYNLPFLKEKIPELKVVPIPQARHQIMNEAEPYLGEFLRALKTELAL